MAKRSFKSKAINAIITAFVNALYCWAREWGNNAYFYILIGDDTCNDVAWHNADALESIAMSPVAHDPHAAALSESMRATYDIFMEESRKQDGYEEAFQEPSNSIPEDWISLEN